MGINLKSLMKAQPAIPLKNHYYCSDTHDVCSFKGDMVHLFNCIDSDADISNQDLAVLNTYKRNIRNYLRSIIANDRTNILVTVNPKVQPLLPLAFQIFKNPFTDNIHCCDIEFNKLYETDGVLSINNNLTKSSVSMCPIDKYSERRSVEYYTLDNDDDTTTTVLSDSMFETHELLAKKRDGILSQMRNNVFKEIFHNIDYLDFDLPPTEIVYDGDRYFDAKLFEPTFEPKLDKTALDFIDSPDSDDKFCLAPYLSCTSVNKTELEIHSAIKREYPNLHHTKSFVYQIDISLIITDYEHYNGNSSTTKVVRYNTSSIIGRKSWSHRDQVSFSIAKK